MTALELLKQRSQTSVGDVKIELNLYQLAEKLTGKARNHLKRISSVLIEFDIHDEKHSEKVIENIEKLLGDDKLSSLSTYELFLLHLSAFLHDCAMAPSDWELNTMKLTEGNEVFHSISPSIKHDLKSPLKLSSAIETVKQNKSQIYGKYPGDISNWMFSHRDEEQLVLYLANLLIDYQNHRNGFADQLRCIKSETEFNELSEFIRMDYIRATHHLRIETYVKNLDKIFEGEFDQPAWGKKLANDLATICRSHGEDVSFIEDLNPISQYYGSASANLQFVAMMLRLGDIIHFSFDRAPIDLRSSKIFKSEYSFQQWAIKHSGANYSIENGQVSFRAYCGTPETYFKLHQYLDWIEVEIQHYFKFQRQWQSNYLPTLKDKIERSNVSFDEDVFLPKLGLSFSLNQKKILELLMGVGLYKDKFACLRELYQNSLDACRCMISQNASSGWAKRGRIEFKIERTGHDIYLSCIDNGIGMNKDIIENYLLKIGNSYYKSSSFFKQQASWGGNFTPTSQFGIGILSCFMIGNRIEITTKKIGEEYISCAVDGPHENFYYKKTSTLDKEAIPISGSIIRIKLHEETNKDFNDEPIQKLGVSLFNNSINLPEKFNQYKNDLKKWETNIYKIIDDFVGILPDNVDLLVYFNVDSSLPIYSKPIPIRPGNRDLNLDQGDYAFIDYLNSHRNFFPKSIKFSQLEDFLTIYDLKLSFKEVDFIASIAFPRKEYLLEESYRSRRAPNFGGHGVCVDGIRVGDSHLGSQDMYYMNALTDIGLINFTGEIRPKLSVDRRSAIDFPKDCEKIAKHLSKLFIEEVINLTNKHIESNQFEIHSPEMYSLWEYVFDIVGFADLLFINEMAYTQQGEMHWKGLLDILPSRLSIKEFLLGRETTLNEFNFSIFDTLTQRLILNKLISCKKIEVLDDQLLLTSEGLIKNNLLKKRNSISDYHLLIKADEWKIFNPEYDIISGLYPLIPSKLFNLLNNMHIEKINERVIVTHSYSNGLTSVFFQDPRLVNPNLGLYMKERGWRTNSKLFYNFENKRSSINLFEINNYYQGNEPDTRYVLMVYISPAKLDSEHTEELSKISKIDPDYSTGVQEGWTLLLTSMDTDNIFIFPGRISRQKMVSLIPDHFWEKYSKVTFLFTDQTEMVRQAKEE